jgi:alpha/beta superfamily hydrolase
MTFIIPGDTVQLEAILREPKESARGAVVVCHPHPVYGGTMDNRIVYRAAKAAASAGFAALRFNFRGVGKSSGQFDQGLGEQEDVSAAIRWLQERYPELPLALMGYSFGAWVGLRVGCADSNIKAMVGIAPPLNLYAMEYLIQNTKPSLFIVGTQDEFCSTESILRLKPRLPATSSVHILEGADHFFSDQLDSVVERIFEFFDRLLPGNSIS